MIVRLIPEANALLMLDAENQKSTLVWMGNEEVRKLAADARKAVLQMDGPELSVVGPSS